MPVPDNQCQTKFHFFFLITQLVWYFRQCLNSILESYFVSLDEPIFDLQFFIYVKIFLIFFKNQYHIVRSESHHKPFQSTNVDDHKKKRIRHMKWKRVLFFFQSLYFCNKTVWNMRIKNNDFLNTKQNLQTNS